jgi:hypothetical protein
MAPRNRGNRRGFLGIIIKEKLDSGRSIVELPSSNPKAEQRLFHKIFGRMGEKIRVNTTDDSLIFRKK